MQLAQNRKKHDTKQSKIPTTLYVTVMIARIGKPVERRIRQRWSRRFPKDPSICVSFVRSPSPRPAHAVRSSGEDTDIEQVGGRVGVEVAVGLGVAEGMDYALGKSDESAPLIV